MPISFVETMRGRVLDAQGAEHMLSFTVTATHQGGGLHVLKGVIQAPPWAPEAEARGTLVISMLPPSIRYAVEFTTRDGQALRLDACKHPSLLSPVRTMTWMPVTLGTPAGDLLAQGSMTFSLLDLPRFLRSWLPVARTQQAQLDVARRAVVRRQLA